MANESGIGWNPLDFMACGLWWTRKEKLQMSPKLLVWATGLMVAGVTETETQRELWQVRVERLQGEKK